MEKICFEAAIAWLGVEKGWLKYRNKNSHILEGAYMALKDIVKSDIS